MAERPILFICNDNINITVMDTLFEFLRFLGHRKKYWLWPFVILLVLLGLFIVLAQGSVLAPFIYSLF
jgi:hypothetical protein